MTDTTQQHNADQAAKAQQEAEKKRAEEAKKKIDEQRKAREEASKSGAKSGVEASKPTPTQEENDLAAMGIHVVDKEPDGSDEQPSPAEQMEKKTKQSEARPSGAGYQTRAAAPRT